MALRRVASELANGLGIRYGTSLAPMAESTSFGLRALLARGYATGTLYKSIDGRLWHPSPQCATISRFLTPDYLWEGCSDSQRQVR